MMRALAILALAGLALAVAPSASAATDPVYIHVEPVVCVTDPCPPMVWCDPADTQNGAIRHERYHDCSERYSVDAIDCIFGEHWVEYQVGLVTVRHTVCNQPE